MTVKDNESSYEDDEEGRDNSGGDSAPSTTIDTTPISNYFLINH